MVSIKEGRNNRIFLEGLCETGKKFDVGIRHGLRRVGALVTKTAKDGIKNPPKTGRYYRYKGRRKRASAAGEYPANRTGNLRRSIDFKVEGVKQMRLGTPSPSMRSIKYGKHLEVGTRFIQPRPFLKMSVNKTKDKALDIMRKCVDAEILRNG